MTIEWLAGNRIIGTNAERTTTTGFNPISAVSGGWKEVGRYVQSGTSDTLPITISGSDQSKKYYMIIHNALYSSDANSSFQFGGSSGNQYSMRSEYATGSQGNDSVGTTTDKFNYADSSVHSSLFAVSHVSNISGKEKLIISNQCTGNATGSGGGTSLSNGAAQVGKWTGTGAITGITHNQTSGGGEYLDGSLAIVLEWDPADTHTSNFWTELASVNGDGTSQTLSTSTFTPKKFMMIQVFTEMGTTSHNCMVRVGTNSLSGSGSYNLRNSSNGAIPWSGHDGKTSLTDEQPSAKNHFMTLFGSNISGKEGFYIGNAVANVTTGSGTSASSMKYASKWAVTAGQANIVGIYNGTGNWGAGTTLKVWGSD